MIQTQPQIQPQTKKKREPRQTQREAEQQARALARTSQRPTPPSVNYSTGNSTGAKGDKATAIDSPDYLISPNTSYSSFHAVPSGVAPQCLQRLI